MSPRTAEGGCAVATPASVRTARGRKSALRLAAFPALVRSTTATGPGRAASEGPSSGRSSTSATVRGLRRGRRVPRECGSARIRQRQIDLGGVPKLNARTELDACIVSGASEGQPHPRVRGQSWTGRRAAGAGAGAAERRRRRAAPPPRQTLQPVVAAPRYQGSRAAVPPPFGVPGLRPRSRTQAGSPRAAQRPAERSLGRWLFGQDGLSLCYVQSP